MPGNRAAQGGIVKRAAGRDAEDGDDQDAGQPGEKTLESQQQEQRGAAEGGGHQGGRRRRRNLPDHREPGFRHQHI
jgi:hypothetical protein